MGRPAVALLDRHVEFCEAVWCPCLLEEDQRQRLAVLIAAGLVAVALSAEEGFAGQPDLAVDVVSVLAANIARGWGMARSDLTR